MYRQSEEMLCSVGLGREVPLFSSGAREVETTRGLYIRVSERAKHISAFEASNLNRIEGSYLNGDVPVVIVTYALAGK